MSYSCNERAQYALLSVCGRVYDQPHGRIVSPGYPGNYRDSITCDFTVDVGAGRSVAIYFHTFRLEGSGSCGYDSLRVRVLPTIWL